MSKPLLTAFVAVFGLATLAGCHHASHSAPVYTPVADTPPPATQPTYSSKFR
jgi:predicted small lipoprotein YifL